MRKQGLSNWVVAGICAFCNAACGGIWIYLGFSGEGINGFYVTVGVLWLLVALVWCIRLMRRPRKDQLHDDA